MTPLATMLAREKSPRTDKAGLRDLIGPDLHCFEVSAVGKHVTDAMDNDNLWPDVESMAPSLFLPSPVTWLEMKDAKQGRLAYVLEQQDGGWFALSMVLPADVPLRTVRLGSFRARSPLEIGERIELDLPKIEDSTRPYSVVDDLPMPKPATGGTPFALPSTKAALNARVHLMESRVADLSEQLGDAEIQQKLLEAKAVRFGIAFSVLTLGLINTPGLVGLRQHAPHRGIAKKLQIARAGSYPLRGWSEIVLKHETRQAGEMEQPSGSTYHKCLHFVRSHKRHYRDGRVTIIPAHWRGDPALGIKRARYRLAA